MDRGTERLVDPNELAQVRGQARTVYIKSLIAAAALTTLGYLV